MDDSGLRERVMVAIKKWKAREYIWGDVDKDTAELADAILALIAAEKARGPEYPAGDRECAYGCGRCRWEPGPWHQIGCPSYRDTVGPDPLLVQAREALERYRDGYAWYLDETGNAKLLAALEAKLGGKP
ncbi:MAG: hypothetical protein PHO67_08190 [Candidatus Omnitrophica bacterium]|nr:hypothetical protein [Candidatus Omnitrophota bacterium]